MNAAEFCDALLKEVNFGSRRMFSFLDWSPTPVCFKEKISSSDTGLLAMYFMETYNGKEFSQEYEDTMVSVSPFFNLLINGLFFIISLLFYLQAWSESYRKIIFERIFNARGRLRHGKEEDARPQAP
jgi:hypothetical protein